MKTRMKTIFACLLLSGLMIPVQAQVQKIKKTIIPFLFILIGVSFQGIGQEKKASDSTSSSTELTAAEKAAIAANNPLASIKTFNMHNYYNPSLAGLPDETSNTFWFRYAQPVGSFLIRASLPMSSMPTGGQTNTSGLGDLNVFGTYLAVKNDKTTFGVGPLVVAPTASQEALGSGKWQGGLALIIFEVLSKQFQVGGLITWQASFAGQSDREDTNVMAVQAIGLWQLGKGTYLRSSAVSTFNFESGSYVVPFGLGIGKVLKAEGLVFNIFAEPQFTVISYGVGQPKIQLFFGLNTQF